MFALEQQPKHGTLALGVIYIEMSSKHILCNAEHRQWWVLLVAREPLSLYCLIENITISAPLTSASAYLILGCNILMYNYVIKTNLWSYTSHSTPSHYFVGSFIPQMDLNCKYSQFDVRLTPLHTTHFNNSQCMKISSFKMEKSGDFVLNENLICRVSCIVWTVEDRTVT